MLGARLFLLLVCLLHVFILLESSSAGAAETKAVVAGTPTANLRAGAGIDHALKATLKEGDQVSVKKLEGEWYQVTAADGQTGYIHKNLLKLGGKAPSPVVAPEEQSAAAVKSPSILKMLEGHEDELMIAAAIAAAFFFVGWICGGHYYLRRDRKRRNKIRF